MNARNIVNSLLEVSDFDLDAPEGNLAAYISRVLPKSPKVADIFDALLSRGFEFREFDGVPPVHSNHWVYNHGGELWLLNSEHAQMDWWTLRGDVDDPYRGSKLSAPQVIRGDLRRVLKVFDRRNAPWPEDPEERRKWAL